MDYLKMIIFFLILTTLIDQLCDKSIYRPYLRLMTGFMLISLMMQPISYYLSNEDIVTQAISTAVKGENNYDLLYKNECQNWRNKINRVKNTAGFPADRLEKIQAAFADFKKEALQRKKAVKTGMASPKEFADWLYQQSNVIVELTEI